MKRMNNLLSIATITLGILAITHAYAKPPHSGARIEILVENKLYPEIKSEVQRHVDVLESEGWSANATQFTGTTVRDVWDHLKGLYEQQKSLAGAILIGDLPVPNYGDIVYWNLTTFNSHRSSDDIWVSRIALSDAREAKNALDASYYYRTGKHRLPWTAWFGESSVCYRSSGNPSPLQKVWPELTTLPDGGNESFRRVCSEGGEIYVRCAHASPGWWGINLVNVRFVVVTGCEAGEYGGLVSRYQSTAGGGNVLSIGNTDFVYASKYRMEKYMTGTIADMLNSGQCWGSVVLRLPESRFRFEGTFCYGDLSTAAKMAPENRIPTVSLSHPVPGRPMVGEPVEFAAIIHDADNDPIDVEWFVSDKHGGKPDNVLTNVSNGKVTFSYSYKETGEVKPYVVVKDQWMATHGSEEEIVLKVADRTELNLKTIVSAVNTDLLLITESTEDKSVVRLGKAGADQRHVWDVRNHRTQFKIYNNENGYALRGKTEGDTMTTQATVAYPMSLDTAGNDLYRIGYKGMDRWLTAEDASDNAPVIVRTRQADDAQLWSIKDYHGDATTANQLTTEPGKTRPFRFVGHGVLFVHVPRSGPVSVALFNLHGRKVASLRRGDNESGIITIDMRDRVSAGSVHILRIDGAGFTHISKIGLH